MVKSYTNAYGKRVKKGRKKRGKKKSKKMGLRTLGRALRPYVQPGPISLAKMRSGDRKYLKEQRGLEMEAAQDLIRYECVGSHGCYGSFNNILSEAVQDGAMGSSSDIARDYHIYNHKIAYHFRNVSNHAAFMNVYECSFRNDFQYDSTDQLACTQIAISALNDGWDDLASAAEFNSGGTGDIATYTADNTYLQSKMKTITPYNSKAFTRIFKIQKSARVKLQPGDDYWYNCRVPAHTFKGSVWNGTPEMQRLEAKGGVTKVIIVSFRGALGKGNASNTLSGWMNSFLAYERIERASVAQMSSVDHALGVAVGTDTLSAVTLEAGTEHAMANEGD